MTLEPPVNEACRCHRFIQESHIQSQAQCSSTCASLLMDILEDGEEDSI